MSKKVTCTSSCSDEVVQKKHMASSSKDCEQDTSDSAKRPKRLLDVAYESWKSGLYTDVTLVVGKERFAAHRLVLASLSDYFPPLLKLDGTESEEITLYNIDPDDFLVLLKYAYSGEVDITKDNVQSVLIASDYLSVGDVKEACIRFMTANLDVENVCDVLLFGLNYPLAELVEGAKQFLREHLNDVSKTADFSQINPEFLEMFFEDDNLILSSDKFSLKSADREKLIFISVLRYLSQRSENNPQVVEMMIRTVRLMQISKEVIMECLKNFPALEKNNVVKKYIRLRDVAVANSQERKKNRKVTAKAGSDLTEIPDGWFRRRKLAKFSLFQRSMRYAAGGQIAHTPDPPPYSHSDSNMEIKRIDFWLRRWDDKDVIGGLRLKYSDGSGDNNLVYEKGSCPTANSQHFIELEPGEYIIKVIIRSGWLIDRLGFETNKGRMYGPFGGPGGSERTEIAPNGPLAYLFDISCDDVDTQNEKAIFNLMLRWITFE